MTLVPTYTSDEGYYLFTKYIDLHKFVPSTGITTGNYFGIQYLNNRITSGTLHRTPTVSNQEKQ